MTASKIDSSAWTPLRILKWFTDALVQKKIGVSPKTDAEILISAALGVERLDLYLQFDRPLSEEELKKIRALIVRRMKNEPIGYILGETEFYGHRIRVKPGVLIPRKETELLVEYAILILQSELSQNGRLSVLDLGCGSGAISVALGKECPNLEITASDCSPIALEIAAKNLEIHREAMQTNNSQVSLLASDGLEKIESGLDLLISNPPYIPDAEIADLHAEVKDYEPPEALRGGGGGLDFYRLFATRACDVLNPGGHLIFEHGAGQRESIRQIFSQQARFQFVFEGMDYSGHDRFLHFQKIS